MEAGKSQPKEFVVKMEENVNIAICNQVYSHTLTPGFVMYLVGRNWMFIDMTKTPAKNNSKHRPSSIKAMLVCACAIKFRGTGSNVL